MNDRRKFLQQGAAALTGLVFSPLPLVAHPLPPLLPTVLSTWNNLPANAVAWDLLQSGQSATDAVEQGVRTVEADPNDQSVGYGGRPDEEGVVSLDASIMDGRGNCGSVCFLQHIVHPVSVARRVMEKSPHVILAGEGALKFAMEEGFSKEVLLTKRSKKEWRNWKKKAAYQPVINIENHDTIGMLAMGKDNRLAGACTTSGLAYKAHGRVGDSPIIGAGLFVDDEVGAAVATGLGEAVLKMAGSFLIVELMRQGYSPQAACEEAVQRIVKKQKGFEKFQVGFLALHKEGAIGAFSIQPGFTISAYQNGQNMVRQTTSYL